MPNQLPGAAAWARGHSTILASHPRRWTDRLPWGTHQLPINCWSDVTFPQMAATQILHNTPAPTSRNSCWTLAESRLLLSIFLSSGCCNHTHTGRAKCREGGITKSEKASQPSASPQRDNREALCNTCSGVSSQWFRVREFHLLPGFVRELPFMAIPFIIFPCAPLAFYLHTSWQLSRWYQKYFCTQAWRGGWGPGPDRGPIQKGLLWKLLWHSKFQISKSLGRENFHCPVQWGQATNCATWASCGSSAQWSQGRFSVSAGAAICHFPYSLSEGFLPDI